MGEDTFLLADVGGTNTRFAIGTRAGLVPGTVMRFRNDDFERFTLVLKSFLSHHPERNFTSAALAIAGPIVGQAAQLTNRDWAMDMYELTDVIGCETVHFVNDMGGLARSIPLLQTGHIADVKQAVGHRQNGQSLVIGLGTGVNASALFANTALEAEIGHTTMTTKMHEILTNALPSPSEDMHTVEDALSGRGLEAMYFTATKQTLGAADICKAAAIGAKTTEAKVCRLYGTLLAELIRELALHYLPRDGIYLSGSVARGVLSTSAKKQAVDWLAQDRAMVTTLSALPIWLITDDAAALLGCLEIAKADA